MKLVEINWNPPDRQLRQFGWIALAALPLLGWVWSRNLPVTAGLGAVGLLLATLGQFAPRALKPLFLGLTIVSFPIGLVVGELSMLLIYFAVFVPIALAFRLAGRDSLQLKFDRTRSSYWQPKKQPDGPASYYRQS